MRTLAIENFQWRARVAGRLNDRYCRVRCVAAIGPVTDIALMSKVRAAAAEFPDIQ